jgi:hypothetical protein
MHSQAGAWERGKSSVLLRYTLLLSAVDSRRYTLKYTSMTYCLVPKLLLGNAYSYGNLVKRDRVDLLEHWYYFDTEIRVVF